MRQFNVNNEDVNIFKPKYRDILGFIENAIISLNTAQVMIEQGKRHQAKLELKRGFNEIFSALAVYGSKELTTEQFYLGDKK